MEKNALDTIQLHTTLENCRCERKWEVSGVKSNCQSGVVDWREIESSRIKSFYI
jgi:hypothetical protein